MQDSILGAVELFLHVDIGRSQHDMDERILCQLDALVYGVDIIFDSTRKRSNGDGISYGTNNLLDGLEVARGRSRKACLNNINVQPL